MSCPYCNKEMANWFNDISNNHFEWCPLYKQIQKSREDLVKKYKEEYKKGGK